MKFKLFVPDYKGYADPFLGLFDLVKDYTQANVLMLTGGADILPHWYNEAPYKNTYHSPSRDDYEYAYFKEFEKQGKPILGICRGAQFLCAMAGGKLVQDCTGHGNSHLVHTYDGKELITSSLHHQMMRPEGTDHELLAWSDQRSKHYFNGDGVDVYNGVLEREPEVVYFKKIKGFGIQGHPEMMAEDAPFVHWCNEQVKKFIC